MSIEFSSLGDATAITTSFIVSESRDDIEFFKICSGSKKAVEVIENARDMMSKEIGTFFCIDKSSHCCN
jgi:hypothetical protein